MRIDEGEGGFPVKTLGGFGAHFLKGDQLCLALAVSFRLALVVAVSSAAQAADLSADELYHRILAMRPAYAGVQDYTATFYKQERVSGKLLDEEQIELKFQKPLKVYLRWVGKAYKGREALYAQGKYQNKVIGHEGGFFGFVTLHMNPTGRLAMWGNRHPITEVGLGFLIEQIVENAVKARQQRVLELKSLGERTTYNRRVDALEAIFPEVGFYSPRLILEIDRENGLPVRAEIYDSQNQLIERYGYADLKLNPGLPEEDFSAENKHYRFYRHSEKELDIFTAETQRRGDFLGFSLRLCVSAVLKDYLDIYSIVLQKENGSGKAVHRSLPLCPGSTTAPDRLAMLLYARGGDPGGGAPALQAPYDREAPPAGRCLPA